MRKKLTKTAVDTLAPLPSRYVVWDSELPGFHVRVAPSGVKTFAVFYRAGSGRSAPQRRHTLGRYGTLTAEQARALARSVLADVVQGADPAKDRSDDKQAFTVEELGRQFLTDVDVRRKSSTAYEYRRIWNKIVVPELGSTKVKTVTSADIARVHRKLRETPYMANRVLALVGSFYTFAVRQGVCDSNTNPARAVESFAEEKRERYLSEIELGRLGRALMQAESVGLPPAPSKASHRKNGETAKHRPKSADTPKPADPWAVAAIRFLLLSGWRKREALTLKWAYLDSERFIATLPDTKTGRSKRPLGAAVWELLKALPRQAGSPYVFPGYRPDEPRVDLDTLWHAVRHAAGIPDFRLHDLRHSFASVSAGDGASLLIIGRLLGHANAASTERYAHLASNPLRKAADATANRVAALMSAFPSPLAPA